MESDWELAPDEAEFREIVEDEDLEFGPDPDAWRDLNE